MDMKMTWFTVMGFGWLYAHSCFSSHFLGLQALASLPYEALQVDFFYQLTLCMYNEQTEI